MTGAAVVAEARLWLGTPYLHQCATRGAGTDCLGLLRGIWRALYGAEPEDVPDYTKDWSEASGIERLHAAAGRHLIARPLASPAVGDVILFRMREGAVAKHLGIVSAWGGEPRFIHAYSGHGVVESALSEPWRRKIAACFRFPEGE